MKRPDLWRRAMLDRASDEDVTLQQAVNEFIFLALEPPTTISDEDALVLAMDYGYRPEEITRAFTREDTCSGS